MYHLISVNHIRKTEGSIFVLFTGMTPKILNTLSATITDRAVDKVSVHEAFEGRNRFSFKTLKSRPNVVNL